MDLDDLLDVQDFGLEANESSLSQSDVLFRDHDYVLVGGLGGLGIAANDSSSLANFGYSLLGGASAGGSSASYSSGLGYLSTGASYSAANWSLNGTDGNVTVEYPLFPSGYSLLHIVLASFVVTLLMIVVVVGNMLVIIAIATEKALKNIQNWFIASLAVADFFLGLVIMPFSLANELMGYWVFGNWWCDIHSAMDVLLCTASIMNLCLISLDRYWSITQAVDYLKKRTPVRAAIMITAVWIMSGLICIPPLLGWKVERPPQMFPKCELSEDIGYVMYSALGSFFIPSCIMVFVYIRIYYAAKARARRGIRKTQQNQKNSRQQDHHHSPRQANSDKQVTSFSTSPARAGGPGAGSNGGGPGAGGSGGGPGGGPGCIQTSVTVETPPVIPNITCDFASDISTSDNAEQSQDASGPYLEAPKDTLKVVGSGPRPTLLTPTTPAAPAAGMQHRGSVMSVNGELAQQAAAMQRMRQPSVGIDTDMVSEFDPSSSDSGVVSRCAVVKPLKLRLCQPIFGRRTTSKTKREIIDMGRMPGGQQAVVEVVQSPRPSKRDPEREKRRLARKKEKRATLILGLIMGSFIACWLPFFTLYILTPLCSFCNIPDKAFAIAFWLGYMNSVLNPVIYTVFNKDFRRAFRRILFK
ncbi:alpha-2C adrenergic receptor isoform X2 [Thrips palmi]|uniref:Alpha-2C adrenergic receptor isoform X2 n=1 Tax=Thrips palmi TaxID=161013 RepID=A0A6P9AGM3_THRPL|nr:alpha-2C adrenergic receptor isoform X2 [Thrips palmi]